MPGPARDFARDSGRMLAAELGLFLAPCGETRKAMPWGSESIRHAPSGFLDRQRARGRC